MSLPNSQPYFWLHYCHFYRFSIQIAVAGVPQVGVWPHGSRPLSGPPIFHRHITFKSVTFLEWRRPSATAEVIWLCCLVAWPTHPILHVCDEVRKAYWCTSTTLEMVGVGDAGPSHLFRTFSLSVNNVAFVYSWQNKGVNNDMSVNMRPAHHHLIPLLHCPCLAIPRMSTTNAQLADRLSWWQTTKDFDSLGPSTYPATRPLQMAGAATP